MKKTPQLSQLMIFAAVFQSNLMHGAFSTAQNRHLSVITNQSPRSLQPWSETPSPGISTSIDSPSFEITRPIAENEITHYVYLALEANKNPHRIFFDWTNGRDPEAVAHHIKNFAQSINMIEALVRLADSDYDVAEMYCFYLAKIFAYQNSVYFEGDLTIAKYYWDRGFDLLQKRLHNFVDLHKPSNYSIPAMFKESISVYGETAKILLKKLAAKKKS